MLEVCVDSVQAAIAAERAGAERIELCAALDVGGVTPAKSLIDAVRRRVACPVVVLIRPRTGDFIYDALDYQQTLDAVEQVLACNVQGVVVGGLSEAGQLDISLLRAVRELVPPDRELVMHRAFDYVDDQGSALEQLISLHFTRVLTSGGPRLTALDNASSLRELIAQANDRITIMPGGGVSAATAQQLIEVTKCRQLHGSFRQPSQDATTSAFGTRSTLDVQGIAQVRAWLASYPHADGSQSRQLGL